MSVFAGSEAVGALKGDEVDCWLEAKADIDFEVSAVTPVTGTVLEIGSEGLGSAGFGAKKLGTEGADGTGGAGAAAAGADDFAKKFGIEVLLCVAWAADGTAADAVESDFAGAPEEIAGAGAFDGSAVGGFGASDVEDLVVVTGAKENEDVAGPDFSESLLTGADTLPNRVVVDVVIGAAGSDGLFPSVARPLGCLSLIFSIAAASRSGFSHLEYDFVFCSMGLSVAGDAGA